MQAGRVLVVVGAVALGAGIWLLLGGRLDWIGRLPGDITIRREGFTFRFPVTTCLAASALLSLLLWIFRK